MEPIRVMIVEDSPTVREFLRQCIATEPRLLVVAECESAEDALANIAVSAPDVISMDIHLPKMSGLEATRRIMETRPTPIVIISRSVNADEIDSTMNALRAGAVSALEKPAHSRGFGAAEMAARICRELVVMSQIKVIRQRFNRSRENSVKSPADLAKSDFRPPVAHGTRAKMIGIVASTGGPRAVESVLSAIGPDFTVPIALVQHMTASFHDGFISWLDRIAPQLVREARGGETPEIGCVYVAPAEKHLLIRKRRLAICDGPMVNGQRPSGTLLLRSMAESFGAHAMGVLLTGMGDDGADGLLAIHRAGGFTIAEDESTAVVNGMPEVARRLGAVTVSLPLDAIGTAIRNLAPRTQEVGA